MNRSLSQILRNKLFWIHSYVFSVKVYMKLHCTYAGIVNIRRWYFMWIQSWDKCAIDRASLFIQILYLGWISVLTNSIWSILESCYLLCGAYGKKEWNDRVWNQKSKDSVDVCVGITAGLQESRVHNICTQQILSERGSLKWRAPPAGVWKVNVDGAFR